MNPLAYLQQYASIKSVKTLGFNIIFLILTFGLLVFVPALRTQTMIFAIMIVLAEAFKDRVQNIDTPLLKGTIYFTIAGIAAYMLFRNFSQGAPATLGIGISLTSYIIYKLVAASAEEDIFRAILPATIGSKLVSNVLYTIFHIAVILVFTSTTALTLDTFTNITIYKLLLFTFLFGFAMQILTDATKSTAPAKAVHWVYNLFAAGLLYTATGGAV